MIRPTPPDHHPSGPRTVVRRFRGSWGAVGQRRLDPLRRRGPGRPGRARRPGRRRGPAAALTPAELQGVLAVTLKAVLAKQKSPAIGNAVATLGRAIVAVREATKLEERLAALERAAGVGDGRRPA